MADADFIKKDLWFIFGGISGPNGGPNGGPKGGPKGGPNGGPKKRLVHFWKPSSRRTLCRCGISKNNI